MGSEERYQEAVECGFNIITTSDSYDVSDNQAILRFCEHHNVLVNLYDRRITQLVYDNWEKRLDDPAALEAVIMSVCEDYRDFPSLYSYSIIDEPCEEKFPLLGKIVELFKKYDPAHICYINLLPIYCINHGNFNSYCEYLRRYTDITKAEKISYDLYHFCTDTVPEKFVSITDAKTACTYTEQIHRFDKDGFFNNLEAARKIGLEKNIPYMQIILLTEHGNYRYLLPEEIRFEVYQTLVYGCSTISYFTYWTPQDEPVWHFRNGIISADGIKTQHYYDVQAINSEILPIGECIANTVSEAVFHVGEEQDNVQFFEGYGDIRTISGGRYTVGFFADGSFLITNKNYLQPSICTIGTDSVLEVFDTKAKTFVTVTEKQFTIPAGGGIYLRKE